MLADNVALGDLVKAAAGPFRLPVEVCKPGPMVTGRFDFKGAQDIPVLLAEKGFSVDFDGTSFRVGCDQAATELQLAGAPDGSPLNPFGARGPAPVAASVRPPEPPTFKAGRIRYRDPSKIVRVLSKMPGLSVIADPDIPGPLLLAGPAAIVDQATAFMRDLDRCPDQLQIEAVVISSSESSERSRGFGVQFREPGNVLIGSYDPLAQATISIPGLRLFLDGLAGSSTLRQNSSFSSRVLLGETVKLVDGQEIPIRAATSVTDRETRADVVYRSIGHKLSLRVDALDDEAVLTVEHELSNQTGSGDLGPSFGTRSTMSTMRVALGRPVMIALSGTDLASKTRSRGLLSRSDATTALKGGIYLVFALKRLVCGGEAEGEDVQPKAAPPHEKRLR
ncbi:hypothetical protein [Sphingobium sp.]|uniref:hypothetical protein n=1 Tax=Sphingobium sp. TaxID=1912891 RepID=UPI0028BE2A02|nr:hypothetical protein [Sphingobium sp.]